MHLISKIKHLGIFVIMLLVFSSCENHVQESNEISKIEEDSSCDPNTSFSASIKPIIDNNCLPCHRTQSPNLTTHSSISRNANNIRTQVVNRRMPLGGSLTNEEIELIKCWVDNGAENN